MVIMACGVSVCVCMCVCGREPSRTDLTLWLGEDAHLLYIKQHMVAKMVIMKENKRRK